MSGQERRRLQALSRVRAGELSWVEAAELLGIRDRQAKRGWGRFQLWGDSGLAHRLRGRASNRQGPAGFAAQAWELYRDKYAGYGLTLAAECLRQDDGLVVPASTLRSWLLSAGLWRRERRRKLPRRRRPRREHRGELVQRDGSHHDWFEGRRGAAVWMVMIDDATGRLYARFFKNESWDSATVTLRRYTPRHGLPRALYVAGHSIYRADWGPTPTEILAEIKPTTPFGRALREWDVALIEAHRKPRGHFYLSETGDISACLQNCTDRC